MKNIYLLLFLLAGLLTFGQIPPGFSYQAMAVDASGNAVASVPVKIRISILDGSATGTSVYSEIHNPTTNNKGVFTLTIGQGNTISGLFTGINWPSGPKFLKVEMDTNNGDNYVLIGSSQLLSVPYAMVAGAVASGDSSASYTNIYLLGSFNGFSTNTALKLGESTSDSGNPASRKGYRYFTAGTELRFCFSAGAQVTYGRNQDGKLSSEGANFVIPTTGSYMVSVTRNSYSGDYSVYFYNFNLNFAGDLFGWNNIMTYNPASGLYSINFTVANPTHTYRVILQSGANIQLGDSTNSGLLKPLSNLWGVPINLPPGNYRMDVDVPFDPVSGCPYTITPL